MIEKEKRPIAATTERKTTEVAVPKDDYSLPHFLQSLKHVVLLIACLMMALIALMFFLAPLEPGEMSITAGWALAFVAGWLCRLCYEEAWR